VNKCYTEINLEPQAELNFEEERLCTRVAKFYYEGELTQQEIARKLGISRIKVHRILNRAREMGIVEIKIHHPKNDAFIEQQPGKRGSALAGRKIRTKHPGRPGAWTNDFPPAALFPCAAKDGLRFYGSRWRCV
jgi:predicted DNA-binding protein (UPF0251 family)